MQHYVFSKREDHVISRRFVPLFTTIFFPSAFALAKKGFPLRSGLKVQSAFYLHQSSQSHQINLLNPYSKISYFYHSILNLTK